MFKNSNYPYWNTSKFAEAKSLNPQILIIGLGTNDADPWRWNALKSEFKSDYLALMNEFRAEGKNPIVYVCLPPPLFGETKAPQNTVVEQQLIPLIKEISQLENTYIIDFHTPLVSGNSLFPDNVHPNDAGAEQMAKIAYQKIKETQVITPRISINGGKTITTASSILSKGIKLIVEPIPAKGAWKWIGPDGFTATTRRITLSDSNRGGTYTAVYTDSKGERSVQNFLFATEACAAPLLTSRSQVKERAWTNATSVIVNPGGTVTFDPQTKREGGFWTWTGPEEFFAHSKMLNLRHITAKQAGEYVVTYVGASGCSSSCSFAVVVDGEMECPTLKPFINVNGRWEETIEAAVERGESVTLGPHPSDGEWSWTGPNHFVASGREVYITRFNESKAGQYIGLFTNEVGCREKVVLTLTLKH